MCDSLELTQNLSWVPCLVARSLGSSRMPKTSRNGLALMACQKTESLKQTNYRLQCIFECKPIWANATTDERTCDGEVGKMEEQSGACAVESGRARDKMAAASVREGCSRWKNLSLVSRAGRVVYSSWSLCRVRLRTHSSMISLALSNCRMSEIEKGSGLHIFERLP